MQRAGGDQGASFTGLQLVPFRDVLDNVVQEAHIGLQQLSERLPGLGDEERKRQLLQHLQTMRQRLQRLHVCAQWAHKAKAVNACREVLKAAQDHGAAFVHTADELFRLHEELRFCRAPLFDVSTALHITQSGTYRLLPRLIEDELAQPGQRLERPGEVDDAQRAQRQRDGLRRVDFLLRSKLLASELPTGMRVLRVRGGKTSVAAAGGHYTAQLTLVPAPRDDVTLTKYCPPGETEDAAAGAKQEQEVTQPAAGGQPSSSATAAAAAGPSSSAAAAAAAGAAAQQRQGADCWRWQLLSFELLPAAGGHDPPPLLPAQRVWLQQHIEQRMWAAADVEQLRRLGKQAWVTVPELPSAAAKQQQAQQQGKASSTALLASSMPALSSGPAASQLDKGKQAVEAEPPGQQQQQQQEQQEAGKGLPAYATNPLTAMHDILCQTAGRLALFSMLLSDARQLEGGSWKGSLKLSRAATGSGLRFSYWHQLPCTSYAELQCLREGRPYEPDAAATVAGAGPAGPAAAAAAAQQQQVAPAVEVSLQPDGSLAAASSPPLCHAFTGEAVQLALPLDSAASLDADRLLLAAAAHNAAAQLAAVQAVLQRSGKLAPAGIHAELALAAAGSAAEGATGAPPASPHLQLWCAGSLQLSLGVQLRTGRLLVLAGPTLLEGEQGSDTAALVAALQQQLDQLQREAMSQPLPPGSSRGMLAAKLVAGAVARLSVQLSMRRRMDAAAAAAAACGLQRGALPQQLMDAYLRQVALLLAPLTSNTLSLALPAFPPPPEMLGWARQHQQRRVGGGGSAGGPSDAGATRCFLLIDFGDPSEVATAAAAAAAAAAGAAAAASSPSAGSGGEQALPRMLLAVCSCTARGTVTRVLHLTELPSHATASRQAAGAAAGGGAAASRKRRASDAAEEAAAEEHPAAGESEHTLTAAAAWCRRQAGWEALRAQLMLLPVQHAEEQVLGQPQRQVIRLPKAPVLAQLESWAVVKLAAADGGVAPPAGPAPKPAATLQLEDEEAAGAGAWRVDLASAYFANLGQLLGQQGLRLAPPAPDAQHIAAHGSGLTLRYSLAQGHCVLTAITDIVRLGMLHLCLTRLAGCMAANPLAGAAKPPVSRNDSLSLPLEDAKVAGSEGPSNGGLANGQQLPAHGGCGSPARASLVWPLPGCGSVRLEEAGLTHMVLLVAPPPLPEGLQQLEQPAEVRLTVSWDNTLLTSGSGSSSGSSSSSRASGRPAPAGTAAPRHSTSTTAAAAAAAPAGSTGSADSTRGALRHIRCRVSAQPPMPEPVIAALAHQLEAGRVDLFLDSLCLAAHAAAAAARQITPTAQHAAGLLPGALKLVGAPVPAPGGASASAPAAAAGSSALRLRALLQQGGRAASLCLAFHAGGYTLVQLAPGANAAAAAAASIWMPPLWGHLAKSVPTFAAVDAAAAPGGIAAQTGEPPRAVHQQQVHQAWVHHSGLSEAVAGIMRAVAATAAEVS